MKTSHFTLVVLIVLSSCSTHENEWVSLVNEELTGWTVLGGEGTYRVGNGEIIGTTKGRANTFLATETLYDDFILELEVFVDPRMNSGIQFRSAQNDKGRVYGYQAEIDPSERKWSGGLYDESRRGWLYPLDQNEAGKSAFKNNEWNQYRIEAFGDQIRIWVNGVCTSSVLDKVSASGFIALQVHGVGSTEKEGREVKWRNVRILTKDIAESLKVVPATVRTLDFTK